MLVRSVLCPQKQRQSVAELSSEQMSAVAVVARDQNCKHRSLCVLLGFYLKQGAAYSRFNENYVPGQKSNTFLLFFQSLQ